MDGRQQSCSADDRVIVWLAKNCDSQALGIARDGLTAILEGRKTEGIELLTKALKMDPRLSTYLDRRLPLLLGEKESSSSSSVQ